ncbi:2'-5' RNA ligase family protein [Streptomyces sp. NPDC058268]|uniref:2'-5' RNA ligase family protein n=1 Tax=Streptomyces sp. NPDC058268 TaxID=3346413 RepID=UPI0036E9B30A
MASQLMVDQRSFPTAPPPDLDDPHVIVEHDWKAFAAVARMTDHWARPGWSGGRRAYYWMLTFPNSPRLVSLARHCQSSLAHLGMDPIPDDVLHVTMTRIGDTAHVSPAQIQHLIALAEELSLASLPVAAHPLAGSQGAVRFTLTPWTPLVRLYAQLSEVGRRARVPGGSPTAAFRPHLGIQYSNRSQSAGAVIDSVAGLRQLAPVALDVTTVDLVELRRTDRPQRAYRWDVLHQLVLGTRTAPPSPARSETARPGRSPSRPT